MFVISQVDLRTARRLAVLLLPLWCSPLVVVFDVSLFFCISPSAPLLFLAASLNPLSGICAVSACSASFGSACIILLQCLTVSHTCLPLAPCLHSGCSRCLFSLSFLFCLILLSVSVSMLLFCTPSVGWLRWLFSSLSVHRGRLLLWLIVNSVSNVKYLRIGRIYQTK